MPVMSARFATDIRRIVPELVSEVQRDPSSTIW
jgi:hypothetical protein